MPTPEMLQEISDLREIRDNLIVKEKSYGSNEFISKVTELLNHKYDKELATLQADSVTLQQIKLQSLILLEVLEELRNLHTSINVGNIVHQTAMDFIKDELKFLHQKPVEIPKVNIPSVLKVEPVSVKTTSTGDPLPITPSTTSAPNKS